MNIRQELHFRMLPMAANFNKEIPPERCKQPTLDLRKVADLIQALDQNKKSLLHQVRSVRFAPGWLGQKQTGRAIRRGPSAR